MALLVQVRSEKTQAAYGGAVELVTTEGGIATDLSRNRSRVVGTLRSMAESVERGECDDLLIVEAAPAVVSSAPVRS